MWRFPSLSGAKGSDGESEIEYDNLSKIQTLLLANALGEDKGQVQDKFVFVEWVTGRSAVKAYNSFSSSYRCFYNYEKSLEWQVGKRVFPQDSSISSVSSTPSRHIRAGSLTADNTIKNDYLPYGNYSSRCVVHMDSASHVSTLVSWTAVPIETSVWLDLSVFSLQMSHQNTWWMPQDCEKV